MAFIPTDEWTSCVDPARPATLNDNGQFTTAGEMWQRGETGVGWLRRKGVTADGFGLALENDGYVGSYEVEGSELRAGMVADDRLATGKAFLTRQVWNSHPSYDARREQDNGVNLSVPWPEGGDRLRYDGTRTGKSVIPTGPDDPVAIRASRDGTGDHVLLCHVVEVQRWMFGQQLTGMAGACHAHFTPRSPFTVMVGQGRIRVVARTTTDLITNQQPPEKIAGGIALTEKDIGSYIGICHSVKVDPFHGHLTTNIAKRAGEWHQVVSQRDGLGYTYKPGDQRTLMFYPILGGTYTWHNDNKLSHQNWDPEFGAVRESRYGWSGVMVDRPEFDMSDMMAHADAVLAGSAAPPPPVPPGDDSGDLASRVAKLERRVDRIRKRERQEAARWEGIRATLASLLEDW